jgi:hypothetical protein
MVSYQQPFFLCVCFAAILLCKAYSLGLVVVYMLPRAAEEIFGAFFLSLERVLQCFLMICGTEGSLGLYVKNRTIRSVLFLVTLLRLKLLSIDPTREMALFITFLL